MQSAVDSALLNQGEKKVPEEVLLDEIIYNSSLKCHLYNI